ncbi:MAG: AAA family ATPase [Dethiobacteria bacterium]
MEVFEGVLERITYYSSETSFMVGRLGREGKEALVFTGYFPPLQEGESLRLKGSWKMHPRYGRQLKVSEWESIVPTTLKGLEGFLSCGLIKGVGPHTAGLLIKHFGMDTLKILEEEPGRLQEISGIGPKKAELIHQSYLRHKEIKEVMIFLQGYNISPAMAVRLFKHYGKRTIPLLQEDPYRLAEDVFGIGFLTADRIARQLGLPFNSPGRVRAAILFLLNKASAEGHVYLPKKELCTKVMELLYGHTSYEKEGSQGVPNTATFNTGETDYRPPSPEGTKTFPGMLPKGIQVEMILKGLEQLAEERLIFCSKLFNGEEVVYSAPLYYAEKGSAEKILLLLQRQMPPLKAVEDGVVEKVLGMEKIIPAPEQLEVVSGACQHGIMVVTGGPGTGKTTIIRALIKIFQHYHLKTMLAAPTGRAAKRMTEATGMEAKTIHRLLEYSYQEGKGFCFQRHEDNPLETQVLILDEVSMMDLFLFYNLLKAIPSGCRLILVGDIDQLPSVGAGNVLRDLIASTVVPCVRLKTIFRQAQESMIVINAHRINTGEFPIINRKHKDFFFINEEDPEKVASVIVDLCRERLPQFGAFDPMEEIQVLTPMHRTPVGVERLNNLLQHELNPPMARKKEVKIGGGTFRVGDKVMQIRNNYEKEVFNGDVGRIVDLDLDEGGMVVSYADFLTDREIFYDFKDIDELVLSYAVSVHKSQGSEYPVVVMPVVTQHFILLQRNLLYTAITRARRMVVLVGTSRALSIAINNNKVESRYSNLAYLLSHGVFSP